MDATNTINIFYCYAPEDKELREELDKQLKPLVRQYRLNIWDDSAISLGAEWEKEVQEKLDTAHIILLLVSPDFMASDYVYNSEMSRAMERHQAGEASVIPVILRPVDWQEAPFSILPVLPEDAKPVTTRPDRDGAFLDVAKGIRKVVLKVIDKKGESSRTIEARVLPLSVKERILQILYEKRSDPLQACDGEDLAHLIGKQWHEIQSDVASLEKKGYIVTKRSQIRTRIFHRLGITAEGVDYFESEVQLYL